MNYFNLALFDAKNLMELVEEFHQKCHGLLILILPGDTCYN